MTVDAPTAPIIRRAASADLPRIGRLGALLVEVHHDFDAQRFLAARNRTPADYGSFLGTQLKNPDVILLVADDNGDVIGYTYAGLEGRDYMSLRGPAGVLYDIVVDPEHRRSGVGRALLEATVASLKARGAPMVVFTGLAVMIIMGFGGWQVLHGEMSIGTFTE